jgi:hypothetical protein
MPVETRYLTTTVYTTYSRVLSAIQTFVYEVLGYLNYPKWGIRVFLVHADESETEITSGTPVARAIYIEDGETYNIWSCPETVCVSTDRIVVKLYASCLTPVSWNFIRSWFSEQLGASKINATTWTMYYYLTKLSTTYYFWYGDSTYNSRVANFSYTPAVAGVGFSRGYII